MEANLFLSWIVLPCNTGRTIYDPLRFCKLEKRKTQNAKPDPLRFLTPYVFSTFSVRRLNSAIVYQATVNFADVINTH